MKNLKKLNRKELSTLNGGAKGPSRCIVGQTNCGILYSCCGYIGQPGICLPISECPIQY